MTLRRNPFAHSTGFWARLHALGEIQITHVGIVSAILIRSVRKRSRVLSGN